MSESLSDERIGVLVWAPTAADRRELVDAVGAESGFEVYGAAPTAAMVVKRVHLHDVQVVLVHPGVPTDDVDTVRERLCGVVRLARVPAHAPLLAPIIRRHSRNMMPLPSPLVRPAPEAPATDASAGSLDRGIKTPPATPTNVVCISTSTGGPKALVEVLKGLPADFPLPILLMQHIPEGFAEQLAENLSSHSQIPVRVGIDGELVKPGVAWLAPGDFHMGVVRERRDVRLRLTKDPKVNNCRPAGDFLLDDAVRAWGPSVLSVVLTGMGRDGEDGSRRVRDAGGVVFAQDEATSVVWGMPGAVARAELAHQILPLHEVAHAIIRRARRVAPRTNDTCNARRIAS